MLAWFMAVVRDELRSVGSVAFFLVVALTVGAGASWFEGGQQKYAAARQVHAEVAGTSTTQAILPH